MIDFPHCRIMIESEANSGAWNMAVDQTLLQSALEGGTCTLRFYRWKRATLSLGYFQKNVPEEYANHPSLNVVRRLSGGGAILHHHELTYSIALPADHPLSIHPRQLYQQIHASVAACLQDVGVPVETRGTDQKLSNEPFLCFSRGDANDLVLGPHKILGSAQRRRRGAVLQHGSLLLKRSEYAPQYPGLIDLSPQATLGSFSASELAQQIFPLLAADAKEQSLTKAELLDVQYLAGGQYQDVSSLPGRSASSKQNDTR